MSDHSIDKENIKYKERGFVAKYSDLSYGITIEFIAKPNLSLILDLIFGIYNLQFSSKQKKQIIPVSLSSWHLPINKTINIYSQYELWMKGLALFEKLSTAKADSNCCLFTLKIIGDLILSFSNKRKGKQQFL